MKKKPQRVDRAALAAAYMFFSGTEHDKSALKALLLRRRIEEVAIGLPPTVIADAPGDDKIYRRLLLAVGEPGLSHERRIARLGVVRAGIATYAAICRVLHGRDPVGRPSVATVAAWEEAVVRLEQELVPGVVLPEPRGAESATSSSTVD